jgi:hypothetical protein
MHMNEQHEQQVFKGMRQFRYYRPDVVLKDAISSPYYWWWTYLRLSKDYWWTCELKGAVTDARLRGMYRDFGNVFEMTFEQWWQRHGSELFAERLSPPQVRGLDRNQLRLSPGVTSHLLLEIPLHLTEATIVKQVKQLLRQHPNREVARRSSALRPLAKFTGIRKDLLQIAHMTWRLHTQSRDPAKTYKIGEVQGTKSLYQIGKQLRLVKTCMPVPTDNAERAAKRVNGMKVAVLRMLKRAQALMDNAAVGVFPSMKPVAEPVKWTARQREAMAAAVASGAFKPLFDDVQTRSQPNVPLLDDDLMSQEGL